MEITKVVKPFIKRGWPNTFRKIVYILIYCIYFKIENIAASVYVDYLYVIVI